MTRTQPIAVGVIDESEIFRRGVAACLAEDELIEVCIVASEAGAVDLDVAVVSPRVLAGQRLGCPLVVCAGRDVPAWRGRDDVFAVLPRHDLSPEQLVEAVRAAAVGLRIASPQPPGLRLSGRSVQVLGMLAEGADTRDISSSLGYSERTIKGIISDIMRELGARNRSHAVAEAVRRSLI